MRDNKLESFPHMGIICIVLILLISQIALADKQNPKVLAAINANKDASLSLQLEQNLIRSQVRYYRAQTKQIEDSSFWNNFIEQPSAIMALIAAIIALLSFIYNYKATRKQQEDTQFYEALKRFGDASATLRCSSVGLLCRMAKKNRKDYFDIILRQLVTGLSFERDVDVLMNIRIAISDLISIEPIAVFELLQPANLQLHYDLIRTVGDYCGLHAVDEVDDVSDEIWDAIVSLNAHYEKAILQSSVRSAGRAILFKDRLKIMSRRSHRTFDNYILYAEKIECNLRIEADRLAESVKVFGLVIKKGIPSGKNLMASFLVDANLRAVDLTNVNMKEAFIQGTDFRDANLHGTKLAHVHFDENSIFVDTNWWAADFYLDNHGNIDESLLSQLAGRHLLDMLEHRNEAHPSVMRYFQIKNIITERIHGNDDD